MIMIVVDSANKVVAKNSEPTKFPACAWEVKSAGKYTVKLTNVDKMKIKYYLEVHSK